MLMQKNNPSENLRIIADNLQSKLFTALFVVLILIIIYFSLRKYIRDWFKSL